METYDDFDRLCDDIQAWTLGLATAVKQHKLTPEQRDALRRNIRLLQLQIRHVLQTCQVQ